jgi:hypothetical protein
MEHHIGAHQLEYNTVFNIKMDIDNQYHHDKFSKNNGQNGHKLDNIHDNN